MKYKILVEIIMKKNELNPLKVVKKNKISENFHHNPLIRIGWWKSLI